jgi:thiol-disulfide isomerase/thioredoxin
VVRLLGLVAVLLPTGGECGQYVTLTTDVFDAQTRDGLWLVEFYAPWCAHCKKMAPKLHEVARRAGTMNVGIVDAIANKELAAQLQVVTYPTFFFKASNVAIKRYRGGRSVDEFLRFGERMEAPPVQRVASAPAFEALLEQEPVWYLYIPGAGAGGSVGGAGAAAAGGELRAAFQDTARAFQDTLVFRDLAASGAPALPAEFLPSASLAAAAGAGGVVARMERLEATRFYSARESRSASLLLPSSKAAQLLSAELRLWVQESHVPLVSNLGSGNFRALTAGTNKLLVRCAVWRVVWRGRGCCRLPDTAQ